MYSKEEAKKNKLLFWDHFYAYCKKHPKLRRKRIPFILHKTGINHIDLKFDIDAGYVRVVLEINHRNQGRRLDVYEYVEAFKTIIEQGLDKMIWDFDFTRENNQNVCRAYVETTKYNFYEQESWDDIYKFMTSNMMILESNFLEIKDALKDHLRQIH